ncbi:MAG: flagellin domain protein [Thermoleophilia bacterium]|jgi:flagellin|nr:flagellin domain protein [Thermoleophilia bacterium]
MGLRINTNVEAYNSHRTLSQVSNRLANSMQKLSSGLRINAAADDAAGLGISERMRAQIRGVAQAQRNAQDGISLVQTAESGLSELQSILHRVRELAVQYNNGTNGWHARESITSEVAQLRDEFSRLVSGANYNGIPLMTAVSVTLQVGPNATAVDELVVDLPDVLGMLAPTNHNVMAMFNHFNWGTEVDMYFVFVETDSIMDQISNARGQLGGIQNRLEHTVNALGNYQENLMAAESRVRDVDVAQEMSSFTRLQIIQQSSTSMLAQANMSSQGVLSLLK